MHHPGPGDLGPGDNEAHDHHTARVHQEALSARHRQREETMIRKTKGGHKVVSEKGKNLGGPYKSREAAQRRLQQVEYFKHKKGK